MKQKKDLTRLKNPLDISLNLLTLAGGLIIAGIGLLKGNFLFVFLGGFIGLTSPGMQLLFLFRELRSPLDPRAYFFHHIGSMIGSGIALHTAFLAGGAASRYFPWLAQSTGYLFWFLPAAVGIMAKRIVVKRYA